MSSIIAISNSEIGSYQNCELSWLYGYHPASRIRKTDFGPARTRGIAMHVAFEYFYKAIKDGSSFEDATSIVFDYLHEEEKKALERLDVDKIKMFQKIKMLFDVYFETYQKDIENWEIISTENFYMMQAGPGDKFYIAMRTDLVIYQHYGMYAGEISPVDHKSTNDWWPEANFILNAQMPMYIRSLREQKFPDHPNSPIRRPIMNFIRTRDLKDPASHELLMRTFRTVHPAAIENVYQNFLKIARRIERLKKMEFLDAKKEVVMHLGTTSCKYCDFKNICMVTIEDGDPRPVIRAEYEKSSYGYPSLEMIDDGIG